MVTRVDLDVGAATVWAGMTSQRKTDLGTNNIFLYRNCSLQVT